MNKGNSKNQNPEPIFPEESGLIIEKLLEKYGLDEEQKHGIGKIRSPETSREERKEIFENLPGRKIAKLVRDYTEKKASLENLPLLLEKGLNISEKYAKQITNELKKTILDFIRWEITEEKKMPPRAVPEPEEKEIAKELTIPEKPKIPPKKDIYREPIE